MAKSTKATAGTAKTAKAPKQVKSATEVLEAKREALRKWRAANRERCTQYNRDYRAAHKEHINQKNRDWRHANAEHVKEYYRTRYQKLKEAAAAEGKVKPAKAKKAKAAVDPDIKALEDIEKKLQTDISQAEKDALRKKRYAIEKKTGKRVRA